MIQVILNGHQFTVQPIRNSFFRRAQLLENRIIAALRILGVDPDDVEVSVERMPISKKPASVSWYLDGCNCHVSHAKQPRYIDNLLVLTTLIELEVVDVHEGRKTVEQIANIYNEDEDVNKQRKAARVTLGLDEDEQDLNTINARFKELARTLHPDADGGDAEKFKEINKAHKVLKKELS